MTKLEPLPLPSKQQEFITFREPTVDDAMQFAELVEHLEEEATTRYLNAMQVGNVSDSAKWTAQDRKTALWWIYIFSVSDPKATVMAFEYECSHCGETHLHDFDMHELDQGIRMLEGASYRQILFTDSDGKDQIATVRNLTGQSVMYLEKLRNSLDLSNKRDTAEIAIHELACALEFGFEVVDELDSLPSYQETISKRVEYIKKQSYYDVFQPLLDGTHSALNELRHGLETVMQDGKMYISTPPHACENKKDKEGKAPVTTLFVRFRFNDYLPTIQP